MSDEYTEDELSANLQYKVEQYDRLIILIRRTFHRMDLPKVLKVLTIVLEDRSRNGRDSFKCIAYYVAVTELSYAFVKKVFVRVKRLVPCASETITDRRTAFGGYYSRVAPFLKKQSVEHLFEEAALSRVVAGLECVVKERHHCTPSMMRMVATSGTVIDVDPLSEWMIVSDAMTGGDLLVFCNKHHACLPGEEISFMGWYMKAASSAMFASRVTGAAERDVKDALDLGEKLLQLDEADRELYGGTT